MGSVAAATKLTFRAEKRPPEDVSIGGPKFRVVVLDGDGNPFLTVRLASNMTIAQSYVDAAAECSGCADWLMRRGPSHDGSPMCEHSIAGGGDTPHHGSFGCEACS